MDLHQITTELKDLENRMARTCNQSEELLGHLPLENKVSAENLIHYLVLRNTDIQKLQTGLHLAGLSSLASCESHTMKQIQVTLERLGEESSFEASSTLEYGEEKLKRTSRALFGKPQKKWLSTVMVTFDQSFLEQPSSIVDLLENGMGVARINCAHDDESIWLKMVQAIKKAELETGISCKIHFDLAGPKIRTVLLKKGRKKGKAALKIGQRIWLSESGEEFEKGEVVISPNEKGVIDSLDVDERVFFDDGMILSTVKEKFPGKAQLEIIRISSKKPFIKAEKGINFPDSILDTPSLTEFDRQCIPFICEHGDTIGFSFVRNPQDLAILRNELKRYTSEYPAIILKIETQESVRNLPELLLEGMKDPFMGIMIARGDLAVEIGFERMVEIQEEISWICEAAHVPVIWATQVLESLHKSGLATRAEITDAGHAAMAECIMVNKGPHTLEVLQSLREIARRSRGLKTKNRLLFRPLSIAANFFKT